MDFNGLRDCFSGFKVFRGHFKNIMTSEVIKKETRMVVIRAWRGGNGGLFNGIECQCCKMKTVLNMCYTTMWLFSTLLNISLKTVKVIKKQ